MKNESTIKTSNLVKGDEITLKIESLSPGGGKGISKTDQGMVVFTAAVVPGDLVKVKLTKVKKRYAEAKLIEVVEESSLRVSPPCSVFNECGGCQWQMMTYEEQVNQKNEFLKFEFNRLGFSDEILIKKCERPFRYRNRIQIHQKGNKLGFIKERSHDLVSIKDCLIAEEELVEKFQDLLRENKTRRVEIARDENGRIHCYEGGKKPAALNLFSQVNSSQNINLINSILNEISLIKNNLENIFDLYCGSGNITFPVQDLLPDAKITGVELSNASVKLAKNNPLIKTAKNTKFQSLDVLKFLKGTNQKPDLIILDPPRSGAGEVVSEEVKRIKPENIIYVSCDLATLVRDLKVLCTDYEICTVKGFDMFPQTYHLETLVRLVKK